MSNVTPERRRDGSEGSLVAPLMVTHTAEPGALQDLGNVEVAVSE